MPPKVTYEEERRRASRNLVGTYDVNAPVDYQKRVIVFFDILGWGKAVEDSSTDPELRRTLLNAIWYLLARTKDYVETETVDFPSEDEYSQFSDSITVSFRHDDYHDLLRLLRFISEFQYMMIMSGFLLRGGVTVGLLFHTGSFVFGPAMNRAYYLESKIAKFPRVIIDQSLNDDVEAAIACLPEHWPLVVRGEDGYYETEFLIRDARSKRLREIVDRKIESWLIQHQNDQKILDKYQWLSKRWNAAKVDAEKWVKP